MKIASKSPFKRLMVSELAAGMGWGRSWRIGVLWAYFDESGTHDSKTGNITSLTLSGAIATCDQWRSFDRKWAEVLDDAGLEWFHMTDFEARSEPPYSDWTEKRRREILGNLLDAAVDHVPNVTGYHVDIKTTVQRGYEDIVAKLTKDWAIFTYGSKEPVTMILAHHPQYGAQRIARYFDLWNDDGLLNFGGIGHPKRLMPLQLADIIAYEMAREMRPVRPETRRFPLKRLAEGCKSCTLTFVPYWDSTTAL